MIGVFSAASHRNEAIGEVMKRFFENSSKTEHANRFFPASLL
ncbi:conserved hypothetical protein [Agrobacterium genomosp. 2 str. CFBP 5494]|uniref:Uncharacterized protein n=1 Tax=Agrobacterium genomosp. 2 str. CFBP 5494 TaxID=1183436 RepID=A0A9W5B2J5_9HYPH|nr:conserved hypothetical protein [Agrobacterium genomosp. 2 str. CFBP 5494]